MVNQILGAAYERVFLYLKCKAKVGLKWIFKKAWAPCIQHTYPPPPAPSFLQVVCSICELVETCTSEIKSGWRPLFGALRAVKIEYTTVEEVNEARQRHIAAVLDVFNVFLNTDNTMVFANAAVDCILCLLKYVKGPGELGLIIYI